MALGWLGPVGSGVARAADAVGRAVEVALNTIAEVVSDPVESVGNALQDLLARPRGVAAVGPVLGWAGAVLSGVCDLIAVALKSVLDALSGLAAGLVRVLGGALGGDVALIRRGGLDVAFGVSGGVLLVLGECVSFLQAIYPLVQPPDRGLTDEERAVVSRALGTSLALYNVRLYEGKAGLFGTSARPFTLGNKIYLKDRDVSVEHGLLVHECVHAWQYQHFGPRYAVQALAAQFTMENAYDWEAAVDGGCTDWSELNREAQAELLEDAYGAGKLVDADGRLLASGHGAFFAADGASTFGRFAAGGVDYGDIANGAVAEIRRARSWRPSGVWGRREPHATA